MYMYVHVRVCVVGCEGVCVSIYLDVYWTYTFIYLVGNYAKIVFHAENYISEFIFDKNICRYIYL